MESGCPILSYMVIGISSIFIMCFSYVKQRYFRKSGSGEKLLAFFHPHCDNGGGGERVLWVMIAALLQNENLWKKLKIIIYSSKEEKHKEKILASVKDSFRIDITEYSDRISLIHISTTALLDAKWYPIATMMFQSFASVIVGMECICRCTPDIYCDTMGAAFTYPVAKLIGQCHVVTYTHYPIISSDMLQRVRDQRPAHNNDDVIARSVTISAFKLVYYRLFASAYSLVGSYADKVIVNSSWTAKHISQVWGLDNDSEIIESDRKYNMAKTARKLAAGHDISCDQRQKEGNQKNRKSLVKIFPPCNTTHLQEIPLVGKKSRRRVVLSIGQFRPEKDHMLQLRALKALRDLNDRYLDVKLVIVGSTRNDEDEALVCSLISEADSLGITEAVVFVVNAPFSELYDWLKSSQIGLHTMWNEHFGISIVEMMAAGLVTVAHKSGGPLMDLIIPAVVDSPTSTSGDRSPSTGYLATTPEEYAACIGSALDNYGDSLPLRQRAREVSKTFSDEVFQAAVVEEFRDILC